MWHKYERVVTSIEQDICGRYLVHLFTKTLNLHANHLVIQFNTSIAADTLCNMLALDQTKVDVKEPLPWDNNLPDNILLYTIIKECVKIDNAIQNPEPPKIHVMPLKKTIDI